MIFRVSQNNYFLLSKAQLSLFGSEKSPKRKGIIYFVLLHSVAQENHNSTSVEENYFHSPDIFQASLCFDNLFSVKLPYLSNTLVFPG